MMNRNVGTIDVMDGIPELEVPNQVSTLVFLRDKSHFKIKSYLDPKYIKLIKIEQV